MVSSSNLTTVLVTVGALVAVVAGYAMYFDYKRRNDSEFRKKLRKNRKRAQKLEQVQEKKQTANLDEAVARALDILPKDDPNELANLSAPEREELFVGHVQSGENAAKIGETELAAAHFYKAMLIYPNPVELIVIYQKTVPEQVFQLIVAMMSHDMSLKQEKYYSLYPPAEMNVKLETKEIPPTTPGGKSLSRRVMVTRAAFKTGQVIYTEEAAVSVLNPHFDGEFCHHCLKRLSETTNFNCTLCDKVKFCSEKCQDIAWSHYHQLLCEKRDHPEASNYVEFLVKEKSTASLTIAKLIASSVAKEEKRVEEGAKQEQEFGVFEHLERLKYLELKVEEKEKKELDFVQQLLAKKLPGLQDFVNETRFITLKGKILYNGFNVYGDTDQHHDSNETFRITEHKSGKVPIGSAVCIFSSYPQHHCEPNAKLVSVNSDNPTELSLIALRDIAEGEEVTTSWVTTDEPVVFRRKKLAETWRYVCKCDKCDRELAAELLSPKPPSSNDANDSNNENSKDSSEPVEATTTSSPTSSVVFVDPVSPEQAESTSAEN